MCKVIVKNPNGTVKEHEITPVPATARMPERQPLRLPPRGATSTAWDCSARIVKMGAGRK